MAVDCCAFEFRKRCGKLFSSAGLIYTSQLGATWLKILSRAATASGTPESLLLVHVVEMQRATVVGVISSLARTEGVKGADGQR